MHLYTENEVLSFSSLKVIALIDRHTDRYTERYTYRHTERQTDGQTDLSEVITYSHTRMAKIEELFKTGCKTMKAFL